MNSNVTKIVVKSINKESLKLYIQYLKSIFHKLNIDFKYFSFPTKRNRLTVLKSPHVNKKAKEQFEIQHYKSFFLLKSQTDFRILKFLILNKPKTLKIELDLIRE